MAEQQRRGSATTPRRTAKDAPPAALPADVAELVFAAPLAPRRLSDLILKDEIVADVEELLLEHRNMALLRSHSLEPRHKVLLIGPPGNGKTSLAEAIACELDLPLLVVRYDAIVDSFLGATSTRLRKLIDYASRTPCVLFFDEFDAVGKERNDNHETGEIKRVVGSLLLSLDRLPSHAVVVAATNHSEMLDRAVWRRFELKLQIDLPDREQLRAWFARFEASLGNARTGFDAEAFADALEGENMAGVEQLTLGLRRKVVLSKGATSFAQALAAELKKRTQPRPVTASV